MPRNCWTRCNKTFPCSFPAREKTREIESRETSKRLEKQAILALLRKMIYKIIFERYLEAAQLLELQAKPYSPICSAYISYSRGYFSATVNETQKKITFLDNPENRSIVISDMVESILRDQSTGLKFPPVQDLSLANSKLIASIKFQDGCISYSTDESIWDSFYVLRNADISRWIFQQLCVAAHP